MEKGLYRIVDANFNRAREALRMVEEYCRFVLDSQVLTERAKSLRHRLSGAVGQLDVERLMAARDTEGDVGVGVKAAEQLYRADIFDSFTAAAKRLTEALRVLAETIYPLDAGAAGELEAVRYEAYTLEKDIVLASSGREKFAKVRLYVIISKNHPADVISLTCRCLKGGVDCLQLRAKGMADDQLLATAVEFVRLCRDTGCVSVINDRVDIAVAADADGVHLGQGDIPVAEARKLMRKPMIIGKSTHSMGQLQVAMEQRPTYIALGPAFETKTKPDYEVAGVEYVREGVKVLNGAGIGHVAIGGINSNNLGLLIDAGVRTVAISSAVTEAADPVQACRGLKEILNSKF